MRRNPPLELAIVENGTVRNKRVEEKTHAEWPLAIEKFGEIGGALLSYFGHENFPNAPLPDYLIAEGIDASAGVAEEIWLRISWHAERDPDWYTNIGTLCAVLARHDGGQYPRMVSQHILYMKDRLVIVLDVGTFGINAKLSTDAGIVRLS